MLHAAFVRSPYAHGRLLAIDTSAALEQHGVRAVLTGADIAASVDPFPLNARDMEVARAAIHPVLARDRVRYVGEPVALVVADTAEQAADAAEWVVLEVEELPALVDPQQAEGAPPLHDKVPDNVTLRWRHAEGDVDGAFARAHAVVGARIRVPRLIAAPLEPRVVLAAHDPESDVLTLWLSAQDQHRQLAGLTVRAPSRARAAPGSSRSSPRRLQLPGRETKQVDHPHRKDHRCSHPLQRRLQRRAPMLRCERLHP